MKKTAFKAFAFSFVFSLFAVFSANGLHRFGNKRPAADTFNIPSRNISLFFKSEGNSLVPASDSAPNLAAAKTEKVQVGELALMESPPLPPVDAESFAPAAGEAPIPLEYAAYEESSFPDILNIPLATYQSEREAEAVETALEEAEAKAIVANFEAFKKAAPPVKADDLIISTESAEDAEDIVYQPAKAPETPKTAEAAEETAVTAIPLERADASADAAKSREKIRIVKGPAKETDKIASTANNVSAKPLAAKEVSGGLSGKEILWSPLSEKKDTESPSPAGKRTSPWVVAKALKYPKNKMMQEEFSQSEEEISKILAEKNAVLNAAGVQLADKTLQNALIPIPEKIMKEENLTPQLISSEKNKALEESILKKTSESEEAVPPENTENNENEPAADAVVEAGGEKKGILKGLSSIFSSTPSVGSAPQSDDKAPQNDFFKQITGKLAKKAPEKILPTEMRLSFRPNRAEISGQTLKWLHAFANKLKEDPATILEVRIDGSSSFALQQKRLNLLHNILSSKGADLRRVNIIFTTREPNSFIVRAVKLGKEEDVYKGRKAGNNASEFDQW